MVEDGLWLKKLYLENKNKESNIQPILLRRSWNLTFSASLDLASLSEAFAKESFLKLIWHLGVLASWFFS